MEAVSIDEQLQQAAADIIVRIKELQASSEWVERSQDPCLRYTLQIGPRLASKGVHVCSFSMEKVLSFLQKQDSLGKINPQLLQIRVLYQKEQTLKVHYMQYRGIWPVANRDFVNVAMATAEGEDKVYIGTKSCGYPHPEVKGVVRAEVFIGAFIVERIDEERTRVTYISDANLKGWIPTFLKNALANLQGGIAHKIEEVMKREKY